MKKSIAFIRDLSKVKIAVIAAITFVFFLIINLKTIVEIIDNKGLVLIEKTHDFNVEDENSMSGALADYHLEPLAAGKFFSARSEYSADDMGGTSVEFICETNDFSKCVRTIYEDKRHEVVATSDTIPVAEAKSFYNVLMDLNIFEMKSVESMQLGDYLQNCEYNFIFDFFDFYVHSYLFSPLFIEVADEKRIHRISIRFPKSESYKLLLAAFDKLQKK